MGCQCAKGKGAGQEGAVLVPQRRTAPASADVISKKVAQAKSTRVLALRECGLSKLPPGALADDVAPQLRTVDFTANALRALPEEVGAWVSLKTLQGAQNQLTALPSSLGRLECLQKLELSGNQLRELGAGLCQLRELKTLQLDGNRLGPRLPAAIFSGALAASLEELDLSGNGLEELPASLAELKALLRLHLARNRLGELPEAMGRLSKLQYLDAAENRLQTVPSVVLTSTSLSELWLKGNPVDRLQLQQLPGFGQFLERRKQRIDAKIESHVVGAVDLAVCGLE